MSFSLLKQFAYNVQALATCIGSLLLCAILHGKKDTYRMTAAHSNVNKAMQRDAFMMSSVFCADLVPASVPDYELTTTLLVARSI